MPAGTTGSIAAAAAPAQITLTKPAQDTLVVAVISGTYGTAVFTFEATVDGTIWFPVDAQAGADGSLATSTITPSDNTSRAWGIPAGGYSGVRLNCSALASGTLNVNLASSALVGPAFITTNTNSNAAASTTNITSASANAFTVGLTGTTNPVFQVDDSTSSAATGVKVKGAAAAAGVAVQVISSGTNEALTIDAKAAATITLGGAASTATGVNIGSVAAAAGTVLNVTSANAAAVTVGRQGATTPVFQIDASTGTQVAGLKLTGAASGGSVALVVLGSNNENLTINAVGSGTLSLNNVATGNIVVGSSMTFSDAKNISLNTGTGTIIATATTQKLGFYNATPVVQPPAATGVTTGTTGASTGVSLDTTFKGASGASAYTISGLVTSLKALGLIAA